jgi:predicted phage tail component-like protein
MNVIFDGHDLDELFICGEPEITILDMTPNIKPTDAHEGAVFAGTSFGTSTVKFQIAVIGESAEARRNAFSNLGMWLDVDEPKRLVLPDTPDRYYMAVPSGGLDIKRHYDGEIATLTFVLVNPVAYGREISFTVPSGGSITFNVGGTYKTRPRIQASAVRDSSSLVYGLRLDEQDFVHIATGSASARTVDVDCDERTCKVNSSVSMITLDSDWLEFEPGTHTLRMDNGTGAATVTYRERWL